MQPPNVVNVPIEILTQSNSEFEEDEEEHPNDGEVPEGEEGGGDNLGQEEVLDPFQTKTRKRAKCWNELEAPVILPTGERRTKCKHCGTSLSAKKNGPTSHLTRHLSRCPQRKASMLRQSKLNFLPIDSSVEACTVDHSLLHDGKLNMQKMREAAAHWVLMHEHPFSILEEEGFNLMMKRANPEWKKISRQCGKVDCVKVYDQEKKKLKGLLGKIDKVCLTTDLWQSKSQKIEYMVITGHFVDSSWKLQKRVLNFFHLPPPRRGSDLASAIFKCLQEWGIENKVFTISVDNASANDTCIRSLKDIFSRTNRLACGGKIFHVRCCAHIMNIMVQFGLQKLYKSYCVGQIGVVFFMELRKKARSTRKRALKRLYCQFLDIQMEEQEGGTVIGTAFALNMLFKIPVWAGVLLTGLSTLVLLALQQYGVRKLEFLIAFLVLTIAACFFVELGNAKPRASEVMYGLFVPQLKGNGATGLAISLLGAMVMPHNLFLHSALVLSRKIPRSVSGIKEACRYYLIESGIALTVAFLINVSIIAVSGAVCNSSNLSLQDQNSCKDLDLNKASFLLRNVLGNWSSKIFAIALLASGQSSTITGTYAGQYVMQGFLDLRMEPWMRNLLTRCLAIIPSLIVALIGGSSGAGQLIIIASMILSFELPFALIPLLKFTSSKTKMGVHANSFTISAITWVIGSLIMVVNIYFIASSFIKLLLHSKLKLVAVIFSGTFGFSGLLLYLAAVAYLILRKNRESSHLLSLTTRGDQQSPREDIVSMQLPQRRANVDVD